jgi:hypothetical protein
MVAVTLSLGMAVAVALAQEPGQAFTIDLATGWEQTNFVDGAKIKRTEYVYGDRSQGLLKVKRLLTERGQVFDDVVSHDVDGGLKFQPGFVQGRKEPFGGGVLTGNLVEFDFTRGGKPMLGRYYYLQGSSGIVWVLQFTGDRTTLGQIRNLTDQMARTFREAKQ